MRSIVMTSHHHCIVLPTITEPLLIPQTHEETSMKTMKLCVCILFSPQKKHISASALISSQVW